MNPKTKCAEIGITWEELQSAVGTRRGRIHGYFYNLFRELTSMGTSPTVITGLQRIVMTRSFKNSDVSFTNVLLKALVEKMFSIYLKPT